MSRRFAYDPGDGTVNIVSFGRDTLRLYRVHLAQEYLDGKRWPDKTEEEVVELVAAATMEEAENWALLNDLRRHGAQVAFEITIDEHVACDVWFRDAFVLADGKLAVDPGKARNVFLEKFRAHRALKLRELDGLELKAQASGSPIDLSQVRDRKQRLRDLPDDPALTKAATPAEIKALWPTDELGDQR